MSAGDVDVTTRADVDKLKGNAVGLYSILFLCVTGSAPLAVFIYNTPFTMPYGSGSNGPATFFFATIVLTIFSIAYAEMAKKVRAAGGMYTYVSHGLGQSWGLMAGYSLMIGYAIFGVALLGGFSNVRAGEAPAVRRARELAVAGADRRRTGRLPGLLRRRDLGPRPRRRPDQRGRHHRDHLDRFFSHAHDVAVVADPAVERLHLGRRAGGRDLLRLLVVGGLRGGAELRRGGQGPDPGDSGRTDLLVRRRRDALHDHVLGARLGLRHEHELGECRQRGQHRRDQRQDGAGRLRQLRARAGLGGRGRGVLARRAQLPDHHGLAGLRRCAHERGPALHVRDGPRGPAAALPRQDASGAQVAVHRRADMGRRGRRALPASSGSRTTRGWTRTSGSRRRA